jgi:hypothetical protein
MAFPSALVPQSDEAMRYQRASFGGANDMTVSARFRASQFRERVTAA